MRSQPRCREGALAAPPIPTSSLFDVRRFGAKGDGRALDSPAVNAAIAAALGHAGSARTRHVYGVGGAVQVLGIVDPYPGDAHVDRTVVAIVPFTVPAR